MTLPESNVLPRFPSTVATSLLSREMGGAQRRKCPIKTTHNVMRHLYLSEKRRLILQADQPIKGPHLSYENSTISVASRQVGGKSKILYSSTCVPPSSVGPNKALLRPKYSLPTEPQIKTIEAWCGSLPGGMVAKSGSTAHRRSLFALRKDNHLYRYDFDTGRQLDKILLSENVRYGSLTCDGTTGVILKSLKCEKEPERRRIRRQSEPLDQEEVSNEGNREEDSSVLEFAIFKYPPLGAPQNLKIWEKKYGANIVDAEVFHEMLFTMKDRGRTVCIYDLKEAFTAQFFNTTPKCLLQIKSFENFLDLGGFRRPMGLVQDDLHTLRVIDLGKNETVENGVVNRENALPTDEVFFHYDGSTRVMHVANGDVKIYRIEENSENVPTNSVSSSRLVLSYSAKEAGSIDFSTSKDEEKEDNNTPPLLPTRTQPSRSARRQSLSSLNFTPPGKLADSYNEDLDLLTVIVGAPRTSVAQETNSDSEDLDDDDLVGRNSHKLVLKGLTLLDPMTCDTLRKFSLPFPLDVKRNSSADTFTCSMDTELDLDTVVVKVRPLQGHPLMYVYRLVEDCDDGAIGMMERGDKRRRRNSKCATSSKAPKEEMKSTIVAER